MERRQFLGLVGTGALAGCLGGGRRAGGDASPTPADATATDTPREDSSTPSGTGDSPREVANEQTTTHVTGPPLAELGVPKTVCEESIRPDFGIRAIVEPATAASWEDHRIPDRYRTEGGGGLSDESVVVGLETAEAVRAYPFEVLYHHEIVNDSLGAATRGSDGAAGPVLVTYCSLCRSGMVARRTVGGAATTFEVSGLLWRPPEVRVENSDRGGRASGFTRSDPDADVRPAGNLVMYDHATRSYWSQLLARAICGPQRGTRLEILPATVTTWGEWHRVHPGTDVLLPPPHSEPA